MTIRMLKQRYGSDDGFKTHLYCTGETFIVGKDITDTLARFFLRQKWAEVV